MTAIGLPDVLAIALGTAAAWLSGCSGLRRHSSTPHPVVTVVFSLACWFVLFMLEKVVSWNLWAGRGSALGYGGDKAMTNFLAEPLLVALFSSVSFLLARRLAGNRFTGRVALTIGLVVAAGVVIAFPAIPD